MNFVDLCTYTKYRYIQQSVRAINDYESQRLFPDALPEGGPPSLPVSQRLFSDALPEGSLPVSQRLFSDALPEGGPPSLPVSLKPISVAEGG